MSPALSRPGGGCSGLAPPRQGGATGGPRGRGRATRVRGGDGRGAGLGGPWAVRAPPVRPPPLCSRLPQSPRPPAVRAARCGPAPWPGPARRDLPRALRGPRRWTRRGDARESRPGSRDVGCGAGSVLLSGKWGNACPSGPGRSRRACGEAPGPEPGAHVWGAGPPSSVPPVPCHRSLRALGPPPLLPSHPELCCPLPGLTPGQAHQPV